MPSSRRAAAHRRHAHPPPTCAHLRAPAAEYALNDMFVNDMVHNARAKVYERLLRKLLHLPNKPAVVLMQVRGGGAGAGARQWSWCRCAAVVLVQVRGSGAGAGARQWCWCRCARRAAPRRPAHHRLPLRPPLPAAPLARPPPPPPAAPARTRPSLPARRPQVTTHGHAMWGEQQKDFHLTPEDMYGALAQYYDVQWLSLRDAFWRLGRGNREGYNTTDFYVSGARGRRGACRGLVACRGWGACAGLGPVRAKAQPPAALQRPAAGRRPLLAGHPSTHSSSPLLRRLHLQMTCTPTTWATS
jgi:hypothetical protein